MLQFLCLQMCVYGGSAVPQGGVGSRHLVTVPQGVVGDHLPWGGERQGRGGGTRIGLDFREIPGETSKEEEQPAGPVVTIRDIV